MPKKSLKQGVHLELKIVDAVIQGKIVQSEEIDIGKVKKWCEALEKSFLGVFKEFGPFIDFSQQIELAYFYGPAFLRQAPSLALRDFLSLSSKVTTCDFIFRRIFWFENQSVLASNEARENAQQVKQSLKELTVNAAFYSLVPTTFRKIFQCGSGKKNAPKKQLKLLNTVVLKVALWLHNNQNNLNTALLPVEELLMLDSVLDDVQRLCEIYTEINEQIDEKDDFQQALNLIGKMLDEVCELLQIFYMCERP